MRHATLLYDTKRHTRQRKFLQFACTSCCREDLHSVDLENFL